MSAKKTLHTRQLIWLCQEAREVTLITTVGVVLGFISLAVSIYVGRISVRQHRERRTTSEFLAARGLLGQRRTELQRAVAKDQAELLYSRNIPVISKSGWILDSPLPLDSVRLQLVPVGDEIPGAGKVLRKYLPVDSSGQRIRRYHEAVGKLDPPKMWFDAYCYRLVNVEIADIAAPELFFSLTRYWDGFDFAESLSHESAHRYIKSGGRSAIGPYRRKLGGPYDLKNRICNVGFATLTIRQDLSGATFYLHRRGSGVAVGANETSVVPAGEFQPSDDSPISHSRDLSLWYAMMREYAEEFLGIEEVRVRRGAPIDYENEPPFRALVDARRMGSIRPFFLGFGFDPLSWKAQIYTACVFDATVFDLIFAQMKPENLEGLLEIPSRYKHAEGPFRGWEFTEEIVSAYLKDDRMSPSAKATLALAWQNRSFLVR